jgi:hypothetical protein
VWRGGSGRKGCTKMMLRGRRWGESYMYVKC